MQKVNKNWLQWVIMLHGDSAVSHDLLEVCLNVVMDLLALGLCGLFGFVVYFCGGLYSPSWSVS